MKNKLHEVGPSMLERWRLLRPGSKSLEDERKKLKERHDHAVSQATGLEESKGRKPAEIASLKRQLAVSTTLHEANVKKVQKATRREMADKFQERLAKVEKNIEGLKQAKEKELVLAQVDGNLQLLGILQKENALKLSPSKCLLREEPTR